uniref:Uncharacterized protein n=1 Tax=Anguilla anguilla TaxID=7936 RepID=A0A0E9TMD4_ANGAN
MQNASVLIHYKPKVSGHPLVWGIFHVWARFQ